MDYVLEPKKICKNFTLMEALYWVAFRIPAVENDYNSRDLFYFQHYNYGFNIFENPRMTFKPCTGGEDDTFGVPEYPEFPEIRSHVIVGLEEVDRGRYTEIVPDKESNAKINQIRQELEEKKAGYEALLSDREQKINALLDTAHDLLKEKLLSGELSARGRLKAVLDVGLTFQEAGDAEWTHVNSIPLHFQTNIFEVPYSLRPKFPQVQNIAVECFPDAPLYEYIFNENSPVIPNEAWENGDIDYNGCELKSQFGWYEEVFVRKDDLFKYFPPEKPRTQNIKVSSGVIYSQEEMFTNASGRKRWGRPSKVPNHEFENELTRLFDIYGNEKIIFYVQRMKEFCIKQFKQPYSDSALEQKVSPILNKLRTSKRV